jgi:hypothetical protein
MSNSPIQTVLDHLKDVRKSGNGWEACCPAHDDHRPSLSVAEGDDGKVLLKCRVGCTFEEIVKAMGLETKDLFPGDHHSNGRPRMVAFYDYRDEAGVLKFQVVRLEPKGFFQRRPRCVNPRNDVDSDWIKGLGGMKPILYRLPELIEADASKKVHVVEGEKDANNLARQGLVATTSPMGVGGKWRAHYNEVLRDRHVILIPDNDAPGQYYMEDAQRQLTGVAASVKILTLPGLPPKGDVSDWLAAGGTKEKLLELAAAASSQAAKPAAKPKKSPRVIPTYKPFPLDALPPVLCEYVDASAAAIGCDPAFVALPGLAVVAGCVGNSRAIRLRRGWTEPAILWAVTVAPSGAQKSPAWAAVVDPFTAIQMELVEAAEAPTKARRHITSDATIQAVGEILRDNPRGLLLARDELDGWLQSHTQHRQGRGTDRPLWLELHRAGNLFVDRLTRVRGPLFVRRANCSLCGTIQPLVLARALDDEALAAGLAARFLMASPPERRKHWTEAEVSEDLADRYQQLLRDLLELDLANTAQRRPHVLEMDAAAKRVWVQWYDRWAERQHASRAEQKALLAKLEGGAARLALLHHVVGCAAAGVRPEVIFDGEGGFRQRPRDTTIGERSMQAGITLAEWFADEALRIYQTLRETEAEREQRTLLEWIAGHRGQVTAQQLRDSCRGRYPRAEDAEAALGALVEAGLGEWIDKPAGPKGGRPTRTFRLAALETSDFCGDFEVSSADGPQGDAESPPDQEPFDPEPEREPGQEG